VPTLFVRCRTCNAEFPTPIGETSTGRSGVIISGLRLRCGSCGTEDQYSTSDFHIPTEMGGPAGTTSRAEPVPASEHEAHVEAAQEQLSGYGVVPPKARPPARD